MNRILLLEDHERLARLICEGLAPAGIVADVFSRIEHALVALQQVPYQALVIDRGVPDGDGLSLLRRLRDAGNTIPCLVLTARTALNDRVEGLDAGADDYLAKPFAMEEMVARVRALLRRPAEVRSLDPQCGDLILRPSDSLMCCNDNCETLAQAELQIMLLLVRRCNESVRHGALEAAGWGFSDAVTPNALDVALHRLRRKLRAIGSKQQIVNIRGVGYALRDNASFQ
ncbi:response regulator transcription factor [Rheinheimera aquimaris]|uniref:Response regulator transcription factor n=1 Tax=Rheinheimera aquimaris TaxID=412437 RepID=A0ABN1E722_9GAMM|nr:response regulator transcription factor [Rheinheimera aquimaris]MCB5214387.1 response regulator transcription factor [Rheinheimera aquimaris]